MFEIGRRERCVIAAKNFGFCYFAEIVGSFVDYNANSGCEFVDYSFAGYFVWCSVENFDFDVENSDFGNFEN